MAGEVTLETALAPKAKKDSGKPKPLRLGAIRGEAANVVRKACEAAGVTDVQAHVRGLLLDDLKARLQKNAGAEKPAAEGKPVGKPKAGK